MSVIKIVEAIFLLLSFITVFCSIFKISFYELNESQILYLFSTGAQVIAGLFGITLAGHIFFNDRLAKEVYDNESLYDVVEELKKGYYRLIKKMGVVCIFSIVFCLSNIALNSFLQKYPEIHMYLLNQAILLTLIEIVYIVIFVIEVADPNKILKLSNIRKAEIEKKGETAGDLAEFLKYYNMLENLIISTADNLIKTRHQYRSVNQISYKEYKPQILQSLYILNSKELLNKELISKLDEIRKYRNYTMHSEEPSVTNSRCRDIKQLYDRIQNQINQYDSEQLSSDTILYCL